MKYINRLGRTFWTTLSGFLCDGCRNSDLDIKKVTREKAILVSSLCNDGAHAPVLDIDFEAQLIPSSTRGHYHLYFDQKMSWEKYAELLEGLYRAGIIQHGFYEASLKRGMSMVLLPDKDRVKLTKGSRSSS